MQGQVLVAGAGPVGLLAAIELAGYGIDVRIVDKLPQRSDKSKALAIWCRTLELTDRSGVSAALVAAGNRVRGGTLMTGAAVIGEFDVDALETPHPYVLLLPQDETERLLEARLNGLGVRVERGVELTSITASAERVEATLGHANGRSESTAADWLVACDGAHSFVRHALGKAFPGQTVATDFLLADVHLSGPALPLDRISMFAHPDGILALFPIRADRFRVIADLGPARESPDEPTLADVQRIVERRGPGGLHAGDPIWLSNFRVNERQVDDYRAGRVFLAGDAAHVHSPAGGQGMNTGMQDVCNLAWKVALAASDRCETDLLLGSYNDERHPVAREVIADTGRLGTLMTLRNPVMQSARNSLMRVFLGLAPVRHALAETLSELSIAYPRSFLTYSDSHVAGGPAAGQRAPLRSGEKPVSTGNRPCFTLFAEPTDAVKRIAGDFSALLDPEIRAPFHADGMWLVRPDGYVSVATRASAPQAIPEFLARLTSTRAPHSCS